MVDYQNTQFLLSVASLSQLPPDEGIEVAFAGRSNAGKSSALNVLTNSKKLARISKTPGRTQHINLFTITEDKRLADLPGYGYAKVPLVAKQRWQRLLHKYLETRNCLKGLILLMDIRHPLKPFDENLLIWATNAKLPVHILLTKSDKLARGAALAVLQKVRSKLISYGDNVSSQIFSATKRTGADELRAQLDGWFR